MDDWAVTLRIGRPVEVKALWYNALRVLVEFERLLGEWPDRYEALAEQARAGAALFRSEELGGGYDVLGSGKRRSLVQQQSTGDLTAPVDCCILVGSRQTLWRSG